VVKLTGQDVPANTVQLATLPTRFKGVWQKNK